MGDVVQMLKDEAYGLLESQGQAFSRTAGMLRQAAARIAALEAENARLREALMECWLKHDEPTTVNAICEEALKAWREVTE